jgi:hypothetical protein
MGARTAEHHRLSRANGCFQHAPPGESSKSIRPGGGTGGGVGTVSRRTARRSREGPVVRDRGGPGPARQASARAGPRWFVNGWGRQGAMSTGPPTATGRPSCGTGLCRRPAAHQVLDGQAVLVGHSYGGHHRGRRPPERRQARLHRGVRARQERVSAVLVISRDPCSDRRPASRQTGSPILPPVDGCSHPHQPPCRGRDPRRRPGRAASTGFPRRHARPRPLAESGGP